MTSCHRAYIGLGANLGNPVVTLQEALTELAHCKEMQLIARSSFYRSAPIGMTEQPDFINAVVLLETSRHPKELLDELLALENRFGRIRHEKNGPRILDIDLLLFDQRCMQSDGLTLPHPRMHERAFVLLPLAEIAPELIIPGLGRISDFLPATSNQPIARLP